MDLRQMKYFVALAEELNFGRAAARLHMAQPPLTRQIRAIEEQLGAVLFLRTSRGVELTEAGRVLLAEAPNVLSLARRAEDRTRQAGQGLIGQLDVGIFGSAVLDVIPRILARFHRDRPQVKISLHNQTKAEQIQALRERRIAVGFNRLVPEEPGLAVEVVLRERMMVGLHESHPLCARKVVSVRDLHGQPMILYPNLPMPGLAQEVMDAFRADGVRLEIAQQVEDVLTCVALVASGFGSCITTESAASLRLPGIVYRPFRSALLKDLELSCLYRQDDTSPILADFLALVRSFRSEARAARETRGTP
ncbi:LysR substrate-binding domain-containing protein [Ramlibacter sp.]|uniref:LysR substrate-binding domain-containing protein n=1 Tax=Ramlibacter sp. TaxID=1917967 RepID=UPI00262AFC0A|nr:LysR substrate-binding domain-containing protein [Ramlibacter sp.]